MATVYGNTRQNKYAEFARARNKVKAISKRAQKELERNICENLKDNPKRFSGYLKSRTRIKERIPDLERLDGNGVSSTDNEKPDELLNISRVCTYTNRQGPSQRYYTPK